MANYSGKVAIITGSSRGIGKAIAIELAKKGALIVLNGRSSERLSEAEIQLKSIHPQVIAVCKLGCPSFNCNTLFLLNEILKLLLHVKFLVSMFLVFNENNE